MKNTLDIKKDFPQFTRQINGKPIVYLDSTATSLKPQSVINKDRSVVEFTYNYDRFIGNSVEIGDTGWQIMSSLPREEFMLNTNQLVLIIIAVFVILLVVLIVLEQC